MTIDELGHKELELHSTVISINGSMDEKIEILKRDGIFSEYKMIHSEYARLHKKDLEAIKRGLFLTWYSFEEPYVLKNKSNSIMFHLLITSNNDTAVKIANEIITKYNKLN